MIKQLNTAGYEIRSPNLGLTIDPSFRIAVTAPWQRTCRKDRNQLYKNRLCNQEDRGEERDVYGLNSLIVLTATYTYKK